MELALVAGLTTLGYNLSKNTKNANIKLNQSSPPLSSNNNIYDSDYSNTAYQINADKAINLYNKSNINDPSSFIISYNKQDNSNTNIHHSKLLDSNIEFEHNNMVPFFGGKLTQNVDHNIYSNVLDNHTGYKDNSVHIKKSEIAPIFKPTKDLGNIHGSVFKNNIEYYNESKNRKNVLPFQQVKVGPGIGIDINDAASGGFQQSNTRQYVIPKNIDELRAKNNPQITYEGRKIRGINNTTIKRSMSPNFTKTKTANFTINKPVHPTVGSHTRQRSRSQVVLSNQHRLSTNSNQLNPCHSTSIHNCKNKPRPKSSPTIKKQLGKFSTSNLKTTSKYNNNAKSYSAPPTNREFSEKKWNKGSTGFGGIYRTVKNTISQLLNTNVTKTRNKVTKGSLNNATPAVNKLISRPSDKLKPTIKETLKGYGTNNAKGGARHTLKPTDKMKKTHKQNLLMQQYGNMYNRKKDAYTNAKYDMKNTARQAVTKSYTGSATHKNEDGYLIAEMTPRTTIKETTHSAHTGPGNSANKETMSYKDVYNATLNELKELTIDNREPTKQGAKKNASKNTVKVTRTKDVLDTQSNDRATKLYTDTPNTNCRSLNTNLVSDNNKLEDRNNTEILNQLNSNPYNISITDS